jgi:hemoglobin-like flavoprotein
MTPEQIELVQTTWKQVVPIKDKAVDLFYDKLFELDPSLRSLFPTDMREQKAKLVTMLNTAVMSLKDLGGLVPKVQELGRRHGTYGVKGEHYSTVGAALLWTLEQGLGPAFSPAARDAWTITYGVLAKTMQEAAQSVPA